MFLAKAITVDILHVYLSKQKRNTKSSSNPFNAKFSFEAYLHIYLFLRQKRGIMKVTIYKGFTYVHCLFVIAGFGVEER
jgi:hypothetical protein